MLDRPCAHRNFYFTASCEAVTGPLGRERSLAWLARFTATCTDCEGAFDFVGVPAGDGVRKPGTSSEGLELRVQIRPSVPDDIPGSIVIPGF